MILKSFLSPVTKRHVERQILNTPPLHLFRIIQDVDQYSKCVLLLACLLVLASGSSHVLSFSNTQQLTLILFLILSPFSRKQISPSLFALQNTKARQCGRRVY